MGMLSDIRQKFANNELLPGDGTLYLSARMHDAEDEKHELEKRCAAMESAAMRILSRYDADGAAYREWKQEVEARMNHY